ncbi:MAG: hypothetical protein EBR34_14600 [Sphingomonadaceae bacterium]|nr:hypothetical protein [Sphingomonadaceae bacterium]
MTHLPEIVAVAVAIHGLALAIVNLTPTPKDNEALDTYSRALVKLYRAVEILAGIIGPLAKR